MYLVHVGYIILSCIVVMCATYNNKAQSDHAKYLAV